MLGVVLFKLLFDRIPKFVRKKWGVLCASNWLILLFIKVRGRATIAEYLGLKSLSGMTVLKSLGAIIVLVALTDGITIALGKSIMSDVMVQIYKTSVWPALIWMVFIVIGPVFEETCFRGFLFEGFRQSRIGALGGIIVTSLVWTALHTQYGPYELAQIFIMGLFFGFVRYKTGSLWYPLIMHSFANIWATTEIVLFINGVIK